MTTPRSGSETEGQWRPPRKVRPFLLTGLVVATVGVVTVSAGWMRVVLDLQTDLVELVAEVVLAILAIVLVTRMRWWRHIGFRRLAARDLRWFWILVFPVLPALPAAIAVLNGQGLSPGVERLGLWLAIAALVAFVEEVTFRGVILRAMAPRGVWLATIGSSVLFGVMHAVNLLFGAHPGATLLQMVYATAMGFAFAAVALRTGAIWPLVIIHALVDVVGFIAADGTTATGLTGTDVLVSAVYTAMFAVYGALVLRGVRVTPGESAAPTTRRPM